MKFFNDHLQTCLENPKNFSCKNCESSASWYSARTLQWHYAEEHKLPRLICEQCGLVLIHSEFKRHVDNHNNSTPLQCQKCGESYSNSSRLNIHLKRVHNEDTAWCFNCKFCDKTFTKTDEMKDHINSIHEKSIKHQCDQCDFWTYRLKGLKFHIKVVHKKVKNFSCDFCDHRFVNTRDKLKHMAKQHSVKI